MGSEPQLPHRATDRTFDVQVTGNDTPLAVGREWWWSADRPLLWSLEVHVWVCACLFCALAALCLAATLRQRQRLAPHALPAASSPHLFLGLLASARLAVLCIDPYGSRTLMPAVMLQVLWDLGHPCLVSAFSLSQLRTEDDGWGALLGESAASVAVTIHFCLVITAAVMAAVHTWLTVVWIVTQSVFIVWGAFLFLTTLVGCLRMLKAEAPLRCLQQVDPGCEMSTLVPLGMFTDTPPDGHHPLHHHTHHPRIRITDVDDTTTSYAGEDTPTPLTRSKSLPMRCLLPSPSPPPPVPTGGDASAPSSSSRSSMVTSLPEIRLLQCHNKARSGKAGRSVSARGPATIFGSPRSLRSTYGDDIARKDSASSKVKRPRRGWLRHLAASSMLGVALCLLRTYDVFGLDGLVACRRHAPALRWFLLQTLGRFVELAMAFALVCGCRQATDARHLHHHHYRN